jgi:hypothetical protein
VIWGDNYFTLFPGEKKSVSARYRTDKKTPRPTVEINGWNVTPISIPVASIP